MLARLLTGILLILAIPAQAQNHVVLQLKWTHAFQFAGYYAAQEQGYYREAGLDVEIRQALPGVDPVNEVMQGRAQFGVGTSSLLLQRAEGKPLVALAVIFQHSAYVLIARQFSETQSIHDIIGKHVMLEPQSDELRAYLQREGIPLDRIVQEEHSFNIQDLIKGKTDAIAAYSTNQPYYLNLAHVRYQTYTPRSAGIDFYGDNLFTTEQQINDYPERVKAFRAASLRGWKYAMEHPGEIIELILKKYSKQHSREYFQFEARETMALMHPELIEVGYMYRGRWQHIADTYADLGMLPRQYALDGFLYDPNPQLDLTWLYRWLVGALVLFAIVLIVALRFIALTRALRLSERRHRMITDNAQDVLWEYDLVKHRLNYISPSVSNLTGYSQEEAMRRSVEEKLTPASLLVFNQATANMIENPNILKNRFELEMSCKDGSTIWTEDTVSIIRDEFGRATEMIGISRDITKRFRAQEEQKRFIAMLSHEFRTPLSTIDGAIQRLISTHEEPSETTQNRYRKIQQATDRLTSLLDDYLNQDYLGTLGRSMQLSGISPIILLKDAQKTASALSADHRITLLESDAPDTVICDPDMMRFVLHVLTDNAVKYTPPGSEIKLSCHNAHGKGVEFMIADNGPGIPTEELPHVFEKYFRGRGAGKQPGSGLGLHFAHTVVESHGGRITARNQPQGGMEFKVCIPNLPGACSDTH